jgi:DNA helicase-2/ATP-dependent DNA helicase PcrA
MINKLLEALDDDQRAAVTAPLGNILCIANAGSGKTRVLVHRIAYWILQGEAEDSFMMLTFTNKAANEMMERIQKLLGKDSVKILGGTFHSVAVRLLRKYGGAVGLTGKFQILDSADAAGLMNVSREKLCADHGIEKSLLPTKEDLTRAYSYCRNCCISLEQYNEQKKEFTPDFLQQLEAELYPDYEARKHNMNALDFDDLLLYFNKLLDHPGILDIIHDLYPHVFVDEYQDINALQDRIIHKLTGEGCSLTAVGDEAQCIYGFRGSDMNFILQFRNAYKDVQVFPIRNNYRSTEGVVDLALSIINQSPCYRGNRKVMLSTFNNGKRPQLAVADNDQTMAYSICREIQLAHQRGTPYSDIAILFRTGFLARAVEAELAARGIPVAMGCGISFYERAHIRTILSYLKFMDNPRNEIAFWELFETVDGIGPKTAKKLFQTFTDNGCDLDALAKIKVPKKAWSGMSSIQFVLQHGRRLPYTAEQLDFFVDNYYKYAARRMFPGDFEKRMKDVAILRDTAVHFPNLDELLENLALSGIEESAGGDKVTITTVHKAKGLEWETVFLPYVNKCIYPHSKSEDVEEERRLLYVAVTRAKRRLNLIWAQSSNFFVYPDGEPSPFVPW